MIQPNFTQNTSIAQPIGNLQGIGLTTPQIVNQPSYAPGIMNTGYYNNFDGCCDCTPSY